LHLQFWHAEQLDWKNSVPDSYFVLNWVEMLRHLLKCWK